MSFKTLTEALHKVEVIASNGDLTHNLQNQPSPSPTPSSPREEYLIVAPNDMIYTDIVDPKAHLISAMKKLRNVAGTIDKGMEDKQER